MKQKLQKFGGAMFTPILFFSAFGIIVALCTIFRNPMIMGSLAEPGTHWTNFWSIIQDGAWTIFGQLEILFAVSLPLGLAKKAQGKAAIESLVIYLSFVTLISRILQYYGSAFGIDFESESQAGLKLVAGIRTLDTGVVGAIVIACIVVWFHNRYYDKKLPEVLGIFQGSVYVTLITFAVIIPLAVVTCIVWPKIQVGIESLQVFIKSSGALGIGVYAFLERFLLPTGLHHFVWVPFMFGPAVIEGGVSPYYIVHMQEFAESTRPLIELFPEGGFGLISNVKLFAPIGVALAMYFTAKPEKKKKTLAILLPLALTAVVSGITEPLEFSFLFIAPQLFLAYSIITGFMAFTMYSFGVVSMGSGLIDTMAKVWVPMFPNHASTVLTQIGLGLIFAGIYFIVFRWMILKFNFATPGREADEGEVPISSTQTISSSGNVHYDRAQGYLRAFGGKENIESVNNCATRLRISVKDETIVQSDSVFKEYGAHGVVRNGKAFQVIVGLDVPNVRTEFDELLM